MSAAAGSPAAGRLWPLRHAPWILLIYATRSIAAFMVGSSFGALATRAIGGWPGGDAALLEPGGLMLSELVRLRMDSLLTLVTHAGLFAIAMVPVGMVTSTLLLVSLCDPRRVMLPETLARCGKHLGPTLVAYLVMTSFQVAIVWFFYMLAELLSLKLTSGLGVRGGDLAYGAIIGVSLIIVWLVSILHDVIRVAIVGRSLRTLPAMAAGWSIARRRWPELLAALWPRAAGAILVVLGSLLWLRHTGMSTSPRLALMALVQQVVAVSLVVLRASWLSRAAEIVGAGASDAVADEGLEYDQG
ncbi:MAG: hypothetical protein HY898_13170 [Deltaproteobacteria bacterium]|nr:hypothetical protein [Deltaproteobacteria bacterium]